MFVYIPVFFLKYFYIFRVKVEELEKRLENSTTATAQKQLQLDTMQQALEKLKRQVDRDHRVPTPPFFFLRVVTAGKKII
jgi:hypothetical protein